jgi:Tol biopolymer transport system component
MPNFDDLLTRELERAGRPAAPDPGEVVDEVRRRRARRGAVRRVQAGVLAVAVVLGTVGVFVGLSQVFHEDAGSIPSDTGGALIVERVTSAVDDRPSLWIANPDGSDPQRLVRLSGAPSVAPDGRTLAFVWFEGEGDHPSLATMKLSDREPHQLTAPAVAAGSPEWSPEGRRIAYVRVLPGSDSLWITDADGSRDLRVPIGDMIEVRSPTWSPDGSAIAFAASREGEAGALESDIFIYSLRTELLDQVSRTPDIEEDETAWSPDGSRIAFTANERVEADPWRVSVWTMTPQGRNLTLIAGGGRSYFSPAWAPDSASMLVSDGDWVYRVDPSQPNSEAGFTQLVEGTAAVWQPELFGGSVTPTPPPSPSLEPDPNSRDVGLGFPVCNMSRARGDFDGDGQIDLAFVATKLSDTGPCDALDAFNVVAMDLDADGMADVSYGPLEIECAIECSAFDATDLDGNGTDELVVASHFSIMDYSLFSLHLNGELRIEPILVADPGHRPAGIRGGEPLRIDAGGDEGYSSSIRCEGYPAAPVIVWAWSSGPVDAAGPTEVHETRLRLKADGLVHVVGTNDYTVPAGQPTGLEHPTAPACGVDWHPSA